MYETYLRDLLRPLGVYDLGAGTVNGGGWRLGVHIADVSHYVRGGSALDKEALARGTSIYYADSVIPLLPQQLSNGVCSLNEGRDRLAFSCIMQLDACGDVQSFRFEKTVIRSRVKGVYTEVNALLAGTADPALVQKYAQVASQLPGMQQLYQLRAKQRKARGYIDIETDEAALLLDADGRCVGVQKRRRGLAERIIEEFMLLANQCAARLARQQKLPFVYRVHEPPEAEKTERLKTLLHAAGLQQTFRAETPTAAELAALLDSTRGQPLERAVHTGVLRSMAKACYETAPKGHFGLALQDYAHFTSPIRRYPDLAIHRVLSDWCAGVPGEELTRRYEAFAAQAAGQSSQCELAALQLERTADSCYKAEYMAGRLGECFAGRVSGVTRHGLFIQLENTVEGFVPAETLGRAEPQLTEGFCLHMGEQQWRLGDAVQVKAVRADIALGQVDFALVRPEQ